MRNKFKNQEGGFIYIIIVIIGALLLMRYLEVSFTDIINWFKQLLNDVK